MSKPSYTYAELMGHLANLADALNKVLETNIIGSVVGPEENPHSLWVQEAKEIHEASKAAENYFRKAEKDMDPLGWRPANGSQNP